jgi:predicted transglutaminase-like cysteine proteinase
MAIDKIVLEFQAETTKLKKELDDLKGRLGTVETKAQQGGKNITKSFDNANTGVNKLSANLKNLVGALGLAFGAQEVIRFAKQTIDAASDLNETVSKSEQIFGSASKSVEQFASNSAKQFGMSKKNAIDAAASFGTFGKAAGLTGEELGTFSTDLVALSADLASFGNTTPEEAALALGAALRGEAEPIRRFGVLLDDATLKQEALAMGLIETTKGALTPQQKVLAANAVILKQTADAQGDFARTSDGVANQQRIMSATLEDVQAKLGEKLLPAFQQGIQTLNEFVANADWDGIFGGLEEVINDVAEPWGEFFDAIGDVYRALTAGLSTGEKTAGIFDAIKVSVNLGLIPIKLLSKWLRLVVDNGIIPLINAGKNVIAWFNEVRESGGFVGAVFNGIASAAGAVIDKLVGVAEFIGLVDSAEEKAAKNKAKAEKAKQKAAEETAKFEQAKNKEKAAANAAAIEKEKADAAASAAAAKERAKKILEINAQFNKEMMSLADELTLMMIADEDERAKKQLEIQKQNDLASIEAAEFSAEQKGQLKAKIEDKYNQLELTRQQAQNEKLKKAEEDYQRFLEEQGLQSEEAAKAAEDRKYSAYLELWQMRQENELLGIENERERKLRELEIFEQNEIAKVEASEFAAQMIEEIQKKYAAKRVEVEKQTQLDTNIALADGLSTLSSNFSQMVSAFAQMSGEGAEYTKALAVVGVQIQLATALAAAIAGAVQAANATGPGAPFALAGYIAAMVGAVVSAFAQTTQLLSAEVPKPGFYDGTAYLQRGGNPKGKDTIPVMAHEGEAIIPTRNNLQYPGLAKSWIDGNLDGYINNNFVRPALMEQQKQAEEDFADRLASSMALQMSSNFDDYRLYRAIKEQTAVNRTGFETMKINRKKIRGGR